jgi:GTPase Era involved in 16S rRNA processing
MPYVDTEKANRFSSDYEAAFRRSLSLHEDHALLVEMIVDELTMEELWWDKIYSLPEDQIADAPLRQIAAEITREKLTLRLHQELPYQLTVETDSWEDRKDGSARIEQIIYVARDGHKGIVLGKRGETIKAVGAEARKDIAELLERKVHLFLQVKARPNWQEEPERYREMGLDFSDG